MKPLFSAAEHAAMHAQVEPRLAEIGNGDPLAGAQTVSHRYYNFIGY